MSTVLQIRERKKDPERHADLGEGLSDPGKFPPDRMPAMT